MKKILITCLLITIVFSLFSQNSIGLHGNAGVSVLHGGHYNSSTNNLRPVGANINLGVFYQHSLNDYFALGVKASLNLESLNSKGSYTLMGGDIVPFSSYTNYCNFNLPLYLQFNLKKFNFDIGAQPALFLVTQYKFNESIDGEIQSTSGHTFFNNPNSIIDIGFYSAISYKFSNTWHFEISYHNRLTDGISDLSAYNYYNAAYNIGVKYFFPE
jgi:hypothetical protein